MEWIISLGNFLACNIIYMYNWIKVILIFIILVDIFIITFCNFFLKRSNYRYFLNFWNWNFLSKDFMILCLLLWRTTTTRILFTRYYRGAIFNLFFVKWKPSGNNFFYLIIFTGLIYVIFFINGSFIRFLMGAHIFFLN
jgi:hypothetical protein